MARNYYSVSISKFESNVICEDASSSSPLCIVVSDGSGGGGIYPEKWSKYLVDSIPSNPIKSFEDLDRWIASIWEPYYLLCENLAKQTDGMTLRKFYEEGSFATLAASWIVGNKAYWATYGDSVVFHYIQDQEHLEWSVIELPDFEKPPYLIGCSMPLTTKGLNTGFFNLTPSSIVFAASDALAHYIIMMYELQNKDLFESELTKVLNSHTKEASFLKTVMSIKQVVFRKILYKIIRSSTNKANFYRHINALFRQGYIANDDYSFAFIFPISV